MLGVPQEVVAPTDGLIGASLVDPGDAVEYGQELVVIEFATAGPGGTLSGAGATGAAASMAAAPPAGAPGAPVTPPTPMDH